MKKAIFGILVLFVILILAAVIIPFLIPSSVYKSTIQEQLSERLGRDVLINGDVKISPLPSLKVSADDVAIKNPDGFTTNNFVQMESLDVRVKLLPLISKKIEISAFELVSPKIHLEKRADGEANWVLGDISSNNESPQGPFKRDGRYADINASIGKFTIENGNIDFSDATKNRNHKLEDVNLSFSLPSLDSPVKAKGDLILDGIAADIDLTLETPSSFLNGQKTPVSLKLETLLGNVSAKGYFTQSEDIHFALDLAGTLKDLNPLSRFFPTDLALLEAVKSAEFAGNYTYNATGLTAKDADIALTGPILKSRFTGDAVMGQTIGGTGMLDLAVSDLPKLASILDIDLPTKTAVQSANIKSALRLEGDTVIANEIDTQLKGNGLDLDFQGSGRFGSSQSIEGNFKSEIQSISDLAKLFEIDNPQLLVLGESTASGQVNFSDDTLDIKIENASARGDNLSVNYAGDIDMNAGVVSLAGKFDSEIKDMNGLSDSLDIESPYAAAIGQVTAAGDISGTPENLSISNFDAQTSNGQINGSYSGNAKVAGDTGFSLDGKFTGDIPSLIALAETTGTDLPYARSIGKVTTAGDISGNSGGFKFANMQIDLSQGELNGKFKGQAEIKDGFVLDGNLDAEIPSARQLTRSTTGVELPPSTQAGEIYERVALSGKVTGNPAELRFSGANLAMDQINGGGDFKLDLTTEKPTLSGTLDMGEIDFRPYTAAYSANTGPGLQPWSEVPYNLTALRVMDGDYVLKTPEVIFGPLTFGQTDLNTTVRNGVMTARLPEINLYGGLGVLTATVDASGEVPKVKLAVTLEDIRSNKLLASVANFTKLEGQGHTLLEISGEGRTQGEIMRSLDGYGDFKVIGGVIKGVDLSQLLTEIDETITQRVIPSGIGEKYATKFDDMIGKFKIQDGVISIDTMNLNALGVLASGSGMLDIGNQSVDFGLRPRLTGTTAGDVGKFGVPLRFKGKWGSVKPGPDYDMLEKIAIEKAKIRAQEEVKERVGEGVGNVLGGLLGLPKEETPPVTETQTSETASEPSQTTEQDSAQVSETTGQAETELVETNDTEPAPAPEPEPAEEKDLEKEILDKALEGIFGGKKD